MRAEELRRDLIHLRRENRKISEELSLWRQMSQIFDSVKDLLVIADIGGYYEFNNHMDSESIINLIVKYDDLMMAIEGIDEDYDYDCDRTDIENYQHLDSHFIDDDSNVKDNVIDDDRIHNVAADDECDEEYEHNIVDYEVKDEDNDRNAVPLKRQKMLCFAKNIASHDKKSKTVIKPKSRSSLSSKRKYGFKKRESVSKRIRMSLSPKYGNVSFQNLRKRFKSSSGVVSLHKMDQSKATADGDDGDSDAFMCNFRDTKSGLLCEKKFSTLLALINHRDCHTGDRPWFCDWTDCDYRAVQRNHLIGHVRKSHTGRYQFMCDWPGCSFRGPSRYNVKRHRIIHTGEKPYKCDWPGCDFESPNNKLAAHKRIHTGERPYPCDWPGCDARFSRPFTLRNHKRTHTGEKPFACDWPGCEYRSAQQTPLTTHKKKHHFGDHQSLPIIMSSEVIISCDLKSDDEYNEY